MKPFVSIIAILLTAAQLNGQSMAQSSAVPEQISAASKTTRMNIYIISKDKKFEFFPFTVKARAFVKSIFNHKRMRVVVASDSKLASAKVKKILNKHDAVIGNLWFDSHGLYKNGFSSFSIGTDNFNYKNIDDSTHNLFLKEIAAYTDSKTKVGLGSCYGGASFTHPVSGKPMHGDSLMMGVGKIFSGSTIYASESWVMMKPGIFSDNFGFAGYPLGKRYRKDYWRPVWDHMGEWHSYTAAEGIIKNVNTVALNHIGEIKVRTRTYLSLDKAQRKYDKAIASLMP